MKLFRELVSSPLAAAAATNFEVVVGHSLGGGCASVLSLMLRPSFPNLKCYAFEPP
jgi:acetyl esterase/lipase